MMLVEFHASTKRFCAAMRRAYWLIVRFRARAGMVVFRFSDPVGHLNIGGALRPGSVTFEAIEVDGVRLKDRSIRENEN